MINATNEQIRGACRAICLIYMRQKDLTDEIGITKNNKNTKNPSNVGIDFKK